MPPPIISTLSLRGRRAYPIIVRGVREGLTGNQIESVLRSQQLSFKRTLFLDVVRAVRGVEEAGARLRFLNRNFIPDPRRIPEALTKMRRAFSFRVRIQGVDVGTNELIERFVNVALDRPASRNTIEQKAFNFAQPEPEQYGIAVTDVLLIEAVKAGPRGTLL